MCTLEKKQQQALRMVVQQVEQTDFEGECKGNLLHHAIRSSKKEHVLALLQHG